MKTRRSVLSLLGVGLLLCGCATKVDRMAVEDVKDLSGRWNDTDSQLVSEEMIRDCINRPWVPEFAAKENRKPVVIVGTVRNLSSEHIETLTFTTDLERELINSGKVKFVANPLQRLELRQERKEQQAFAREETAKRLAAETGADYMLKGAIKTIRDKEGRKEVKFYQVDLEMLHIESNEKVWIGTKKIKKFVKKARINW
ncbi:penicillin-binding protein activator LpoB [Verrucomicrobiota bacterium]